jgi:UDP:flavonoid glycosyltransferase YjiC (YdhE family)
VVQAGIFRIADWMLIDRALKRPLNEFRRTLGLPPVDRVMHRWIHSPQLVIGFFPEWFATPQSDWPPHTHLVGFPLWDREGMTVPRDAEEFLDAGDSPLIFTPGSAGATMHRYFQESVEAAREIGCPAMLVTNFLDQLPRNLPRNIKAIGYPQQGAAARGIARLSRRHGTLAQAIKVESSIRRPQWP